MSPFDPAIHHRRSIRLKGHDYSGGGVYFVTICAHRDAGDVFAPAAVRKMVARVWRKLPQSPAVGASLVGAQDLPQNLPQNLPQDLPQEEGPREGAHQGNPYAIMPDHFHGMVRMRAGGIALGDLIGAFKSLVLHEYIAGVKAGKFAPFPGKVWHRNYYEMIVRTPEAERNIAEYIRMNPWKLVQHGVHAGQAFRMIGNPALLHREKIAVLCSRHCPADVLAAAEKRARTAREPHCFMSGFHSPPEKNILEALLQSAARLICCPAWGIDAMRIPQAWLPALETNRMLILEMRERAGDLAAAEARNRFVLECAERRWIPHATPGGMLARLLSTGDTRVAVRASLADAPVPSHGTPPPAPPKPTQHPSGSSPRNDCGMERDNQSGKFAGRITQWKP